MNSKKYKEIQEHNSKHWIYRNILNMSIMYKDTQFYLPTFMDFRGRIYPYISYLNYQGGDLARALLHFAKEDPVGDNAHYIAEYMANTYGLTSKIKDKKVQWVIDNFDDHLDKWENNKEAFIKSVLGKAKEKFQFISAFLTMIEILNGKSTSGLPILFDCSCSGIQHLSALAADVSLAKMVNVTPAEGGGRSDFYSIAADFVKDSIRDDTTVNDRLSLIDINRTVMKIPVMTIPYNISEHGVFEKLLDTLVQEKIYEHKKLYYKIKTEFIKGGESLTLSARELAYLSNIVYKSVFKMVPSLGVLVNYLNDMMKFLSKIDVPALWITPSGMKINLSPHKLTSVKTKTKLFKSAKPITIQIPTSKLDTRTLVRGFMANFIHSLDASNVHILIDKLKGSGLKDVPLYTIHDCFATTPRHMKELNALVLGAFINLYFEENYLLKLHNHLINQALSYGYTLASEKEINYLIHNETKESYKVPTLPVELIQKWDENKDFFITHIVKSEYFIS